MEEKAPEDEDLNWEDFMNVVTTYSCKFCTFTCTAPSQMGAHVKRTHMPKKSPQSQKASVITMATVTPSVTAQRQVLQGSAAAPQSRALNSVATSKTPREAVVSLPGSEQTEIHVEIQTPGSTEDSGEKGTLEQMQIVDVTGAPVSASTIAETSEGHYIIVEGTTADSVALSNILNSVAASKQELANNSVEVTNTSVAESQVLASLPASAMSSLGLTNQLLNSDLGQISVVAEVPRETTEAPVTKELFLCGQCSTGFASIDDCREHMLATHSSLLGVQSEGDTDGVNQVSVGTQMQPKKKPGRKKKSEQIVTTPVKPVNQDADDDDWEPGYDIIGVRTSRRKRKIRPPRALKEDYYLGKKKKKKKERKTYYKEQYKLKCKLFDCHAKFKEKKALEMHTKCHNDTDFNFTCTECREQFEMWKALRIHLWKKHEIDCDMFRCDMCDVVTDTYHKLSVHKEIHSENRPYTCDICGKGFKQFSQMRNHQVIHSEHRVDEANRWYSNKQCDICKRIFANNKCLKTHIQAVHSKERPFTCPYCGHTAARKAMLELHVRTHTGEKPFKCDVCPYATGDHNSLRRHKMRHTGQRQYKCQYCPYSCIQAISLKTHMKNKHPGLEGIYACDACIFRTVNKASYEQHLLDHKNGLVPETKGKPETVAETQTVVISQGTGACSSDATAVEMQVQTMASGEAQINAEDLAKLSSCEGLVPGDVSAASLIYQALSVISQTPEHTQGNATQSAHILGGVQTLIKSSETSEGVTTHTIVFHLPNSGTAQESEVSIEEGVGTEQVYFEQPVEVIEALQRASNQGADLVETEQGNLPTVIAMEATEEELEGMNLNLVPVSGTEGTIIIQPAES